MGEVRLNATLKGDENIIDFIDLREPVDADKIIRYRDALRARVAVGLGDTAAGSIEVSVPSSTELPFSDAPLVDPMSAESVRHLALVVNE